MLAENRQLTIGSRSGWLAMRIINAVVIVSVALLVPPMLLHSGSFGTPIMDLVFLGIFGALFLGGLRHSHQFAYGFVEAGGIRYKRYFSWQYVTWSEIESISEHPMGTIRVDVARANLLNRQLIFGGDIVLFGKKNNSATFDNLRRTWTERKLLPSTVNSPQVPDYTPFSDKFVSVPTHRALRAVDLVDSRGVSIKG
jgi:hypothetical protein